MRNSKRRRLETNIINNLTYETHYDNFKMIATSLFEWTGLPESIKPHYIEEALFNHGKAVFFEDRMLGLLCLPSHDEGNYNVYNEPVWYVAEGFNYRQKLSADESVLIKNNLLSKPTEPIIDLYAMRLTDVDRTLDVHIKSVKTPYVIQTDDKTLLSIKNMFAQIENNEVAIFVNKGIDTESVKVHKTDNPFIADKLADYRHDVKNELLTMLGINNANTDKRERLVQSEVESNNESILFHVKHMLDMRKQAVEEINKMFGLQINVELKEVEEDVNLYGGVGKDTGNGN